MSENEFHFNVNDPTELVDMCSAFVCVCCAALAAGMTIGLLSLDTMKLKIKLSVGTDEEKKAAGIILPILKNHHWLLCTLLLFNAGANEALPIFLDNLVPSWCAIIVSVTLVLICGEVLPTAIFSGPRQLQIASRFVPVIYALRFILSPIAYPMSLALDRLLGVEEDDDTLNRDEMAAMVNIIRDERSRASKHGQHSKSSAHDTKHGGGNNNHNNDSSGSGGGGGGGWCSYICCCFGGGSGGGDDEQQTPGGPLGRSARRPSAHNVHVHNAHTNRKPGYSLLGNVVLHSGDGDEETNTMSHSGTGGGGSPRHTDSAIDNYYNDIERGNRVNSGIGLGPPGFDTIPEDEEELTHAEMDVISGVLGLKSLKVRDICIPMNEVNMLSSDQILTPEVIDAIDKVGHTRLPVFKGANVNDIIGFFIVKRLMVINPEKNVPLSSFKLNAPIVVGANLSVLDAIKVFQMSSTHLALVSDEPHALRATIAAGVAPKMSAAPIGIITIEDIFEAMLGQDINDETDVALAGSRMSAASSLREMSMSMHTRPSGLVGSSALSALHPPHAHSPGNGHNPLHHIHANTPIAEETEGQGEEEEVPVLSTSLITTLFPAALLDPLPGDGANSNVDSQTDRASGGGSVASPRPIPGRKRRNSLKHAMSPSVGGGGGSGRDHSASADLQGWENDSEGNLSRKQSETAGVFSSSRSNAFSPPDSMDISDHLQTPLLAAAAMGGSGIGGGPAAAGGGGGGGGGGGPSHNGPRRTKSMIHRIPSEPSSAPTPTHLRNFNVDPNDDTTTQQLFKQRGLTPSVLARHLGVKVREGGGGSFSGGYSTYRDNVNSSNNSSSSNNNYNPQSSQRAPSEARSMRNPSGDLVSASKNPERQRLKSFFS